MNDTQGGHTVQKPFILFDNISFDIETNISLFHSCIIVVSNEWHTRRTYCTKTIILFDISLILKPIIISLF